jgi:hypothetical protein|tara:strand:- start:655 stop:867 length:213 start_codon:yes stop_codon:yes gene_type:complete
MKTMLKPLVYVVMSIRHEEYREDSPSNAIATHGVYSSRKAAEAKAELLRYNYPDSLDFWVAESDLYNEAA